MAQQVFLTEWDKADRYQELYRFMDDRKLAAIFVCGDAPIKYVNGEFAVGWGVFALIPRHGDPVLFQANPGREYVLTPVHKNAEDYWIRDVRLMTVEHVAEAFAEKKLLDAAVGVTAAGIPAGLWEGLKHALSGVSTVELTDDLRKMWRIKKGGYQGIIREAMRIVDTCVRELPKQMHVGMYEYEIKAILQRIMTGMGAEDSLILINSDRRDISSPAIPTDHKPKKLMAGDRVVAEITVCYRGCWLQKIAVFSFGRPEPDLCEMFQAVEEAIWKSVRQVKPGYNAKKLVNDIDDYIESRGFLSARKDYISGPTGHLSGYELDEATFSPTQDFILEEGMLFVLHPSAAFKGWKEGEKAIFGPGTMFLVTENGAESLSETKNEIYVIDTGEDV